jgi:hypothetical protein
MFAGLPHAPAVVMRTMFWLLMLVVVCSAALGIVKDSDPYVGLLGVPDVVTFTATPEVVSPGQPVMLAWNTRGTASIAIDFGPEDQPRGTYEHHADLPSIGTMRVKPAKDSIFMVGCETVAKLDCQPHIIRVQVKGSSAQVPLE